MAKQKSDAAITLVAIGNITVPGGDFHRDGSTFEAKPFPNAGMSAADTAAYLIGRGLAKPKTETTP